MEHPAAAPSFGKRTNEYTPGDQHGIISDKSNTKKGKAKANGPVDNDNVHSDNANSAKTSQSCPRKSKKQPDPEGSFSGGDDDYAGDDVYNSNMVNTFMTYFDLLKNNNDVDDTSTCEDKDQDRHSNVAGAPSPSRDTSDDHYPKIDQHYDYDEDEDYGDEDQEHMADDDDDDDDGNDDDNDGDDDNEEDEDDENDDDEDDDDDGDDDDDMDDLQEMDRIRRKFDRQLQRMFGGTVSQMSSQFRSILNTLKTQNDPTMQLVALQELAEILSVSNEETLAGYFSSDGFVKELVRILKGTDGNDTGLDLPPGMEMDEDMMLALAMNGGFGSGGNPELMLLACRCLSNLMDALPTSVTNVVYHGATKVLCEKLKSIEYIDLAEQALIALEKIAAQLPRAVINEGGLSAVLMYFDFFSTHSQRTALRTAAICMRSVDKDTFLQVEEAIPTLMNTIGYPDRTVVELSCLCWLRIAENYRPYQDLIEKVISVQLLKNVIDLIPVPGNANAARPSTFTDLLRILRAIVKSSPSLCCELLKLGIVDVFYKVLTGSSDVPTNNAVDVGLDHKWRDSVYTILKVIVDTLPPLPKDGKFSSRRFKDTDRSKSRDGSITGDDNKRDLRTIMLLNNTALLQHINLILVPLLMEMHTSMVNIRVRQLVTHILVKLIHFADEDTLRLVLKDISLSGFLASILTQKEHPILVMDTLYVAEMLIEKLPDVYLFLFQHEGVIHEINSLSRTALSDKEDAATATDQSCENNNNEGDSPSVKSPSKPLILEGRNSDQTSELNTIDPESSSTTGDEDVSDKKTESGEASSTSKVSVSTNTPLEDKMNQHDDELRNMEEKLQSARRRLLNKDDLPSLLRGRIGLLQQQQQQQRAQLHRQTCADNEKGIGHGSTRRCIIQLAKAILNEYNDQVKSSKHLPGSTSTNTTSLDGLGDSATLSTCDGSTDMGMETLKTISQQIGNGLDNRDLAEQGLQALLAYSKDCGVGLSSFELRASGLMDALLNYLTNETAGASAVDNNGNSVIYDLANRQALFKTIFSDNGGAVIPMLVLRLQELLARFEQYQVISPLDVTSSDSLRNPSSMLTKQLRLRLTGIGSNIPIDHQHLMVSTHAVATFHVIEDYLLSRIALLEGEMDDDDDDDDDDNDDNGGDKDNDDNGATDEVNGGYQDPNAARLMGRLSLNDAEETIQNDDTNAEVSVFDQQDEVRLDNETTTGKDDLSKAEASGSSSTSPSASTTAAATASESAEPSTSTPSNGKWHIRFSIKSTTIPSDSTIYSAIHRCELEQRKTDNTTSSMRNIWSSSYPINFERVWICDNEENTVNDYGDDQGAQHGDRPGTLKRLDSSSSILSLTDDSFSNDQICDNVLRLLKALYFLYTDNNAPDGDTDLENAFYSRKLAAKVNRQLEEPLIVASSCLPDWIYSLMRETPFLFPFEPRYLFIQSTSYGYSRLISRWQSLQMRNQQHLGARGGTLDDSQQQQQSMALGRVERQKVRMMRNQILESAIKMLDLFSTSSSSLEIEFVDEEGTGLGPTLEFYALASKEFCKKSLGLWRDDDDSYVSSQQQADDTTSQRYVSAPRGLFPRPLVGDNDDTTDNDKSVKRILTLFKTLGRFVAKAMLDFRIIDMPFSVSFFDIVFGKNIPLLDLVRQVDPTIGKTVGLLDRFLNEKRLIYADPALTSQQKQAKVEGIQVDGIALHDLCLSFVIPGTDLNLKPEGDKIPVTIHNLSNFVDLLLDAIAGSGVSKQIEAFRTGFSDSFQIDDLKILTSKELVSLFGSSEEDWSLTTLTDTIKADHGYTMESLALKHLLEILAELDTKGQRDFLQFTTGSPRLPVGGWKALRPSFTVVRKIADAPLSANDYLPSVMTCANYLKMPDYSDKDMMRKRLLTAMDEGKDSFLLS